MKPLLTLMLDATHHTEHYLQTDHMQILSARMQCAQLAVRVLVYSPSERGTWHTDELAHILIPQLLAHIGFVPRQVNVQVTKHMLRDATASLLVIVTRMEGKDHGQGRQTEQGEFLRTAAGICPERSTAKRSALLDQPLASKRSMAQK